MFSKKKKKITNVTVKARYTPYLELVRYHSSYTYCSNFMHAHADSYPVSKKQSVNASNKHEKWVKIQLFEQPLEVIRNTFYPDVEQVNR